MGESYPLPDDFEESIGLIKEVINENFVPQTDLLSTNRTIDGGDGESFDAPHIETGAIHPHSEPLDQFRLPASNITAWDMN